jgi:Flp pilus assembly protein protease CpaA
MKTYSIPNLFFSITGIANILSAILMIMGFILHPAGEDATYGTDPFWVPAHALLWIAYTLALPGWTGAYVTHASNAGNLGVVSFIIILIGIGFTTSIFSSDVTFVPVIAQQFPQLFSRIFTSSHIAIGIACVLTWVLGNILFGLSIIQSKVFPTWTGIVLIIGIAIIPIAYLSGLPIKIIAAGSLVAGIGQIKIGYHVFQLGK